jgi:hypothetical protein
VLTPPGALTLRHVSARRSRRVPFSKRHAPETWTSFTMRRSQTFSDRRSPRQQERQCSAVCSRTSASEGGRRIY